MNFKRRLGAPDWLSSRTLRLLDRCAGLIRFNPWPVYRPAAGIQEFLTTNWTAVVGAVRWVFPWLFPLVIVQIMDYSYVSAPARWRCGR